LSAVTAPILAELYRRRTELNQTTADELEKLRADADAHLENFRERERVPR
jgi:hypothetical protein